MGVDASTKEASFQGAELDIHMLLLHLPNPPGSYNSFLATRLYAAQGVSDTFLQFGWTLADPPKVAKPKLCSVAGVIDHVPLRSVAKCCEVLQVLRCTDPCHCQEREAWLLNGPCVNAIGVGGTVVRMRGAQPYQDAVQTI